MSTNEKLVTETLIFIAQKGWTNNGRDFFDSLSLFLAEKLQVAYVIIDKLNPDRQTVKTLSFVAYGEIKTNVSYPLVNTPCENVMSKNLCCYVNNIQNLFPNDSMLVEMNAESYIGIPLWDTKATPIGLLAILDTKKIENSAEIETILQIVAVRVAHEIERNNYEQELIHKTRKAEESDRLKSAFLANMSHEIRTPMNGILGFSELLKEPNLSGEQQQEYIEIIEKSGIRMLNIINDIIDISKLEAGLMKVDIKDTNINEKIEFIYTFFKPQAEHKRIQLYFKNTLPAKEATIRTDNEKVYSILTNLVKNAIKYSEEGAIEFGYIKKGETLEFYIKDTGIGIPKDRQSAIFERFIQADITDKMALQGAGLGLSISKAYVDMLGGKIWVESEEGFGSTFYFTLPYNAEPEGKNAVGNIVPEQEEKNLIKNLKILIAEDDETSEMLITIGIEKFGREILKAKTGLEAVEVCRNNPDTDLILMDIQMPVMNGYDATRQIRQFNKDVVIIAQTAFGLSGDREKAIEAGCNDYIAKPINKVKLLSLIQKYFNK